jgi:hypothetical protein
MTNKLPTSVRLSPDAMALWAALSEDMGISRADILERALRLLARHEGVTVAQARARATEKEAGSHAAVK